MSFFKQLGNAVTDIVRKVTEAPSPYAVQEIKTQSTNRWTQVCSEENVSLYRDAAHLIAVVHDTSSSSRAFSLFRLSDETEAMTTFSNLSYKLVMLHQSCGGELLKQEMLQKLVDTVKTNPTWTAAHLAAHMGLDKCMRHNVIAKQIDTVDDNMRVSPLQLAIQAGHMACITELIIMGAHLNLADTDGNTVFHYAAKADNTKIIQYLASKDKTVINQLNVFGESALHIACLHDKADNVEHLLRWGCDPNLSMSGRFPMHCAMKVASVKCAERLGHWSRDQIHVKDTKYGGSPLHWARDKECIYLLVDMGCNVDGTNNDGETPLHIMTQRNRLPCVMALLNKAADASHRGCQDNTVLHMAIQTDNADLIQTLIVFGADVNGVNKYNISVRHMAGAHNGPNRKTLVRYLHQVGARRCSPDTVGCSADCAAVSFPYTNEEPLIVTTPEHERKGYDKMVTDIALTAAFTRSASASGSNILCGESPDAGQRSPMGSAGDRLLCLDGGGIRGMVLIQILLALERATGQPIRNCFDWIGGTSTGGILALAIVHGKSLHYCQGLYFRLKDEVFSGSRPHDSQPLERFMKKEFGENTRMSERDYPRVLVTGVISDCFPAKLHLFRNYDTPCPEHDHCTPLNKPLPRPNEQLVWKAARSTGAAPSFFRAFERFLDGGLIANNPTLDVMTEAHEYNMGLRATGQGQLARAMHVVVSVGTGCAPTRATTSTADAFVPSGLFEIYHAAVGAKNLGELLIDQVTMSEGRPVERARAWCSMIGVPFFRFSPQISEEIPLNCRDDKKLVNMLWETQCYLHEHQDRLQQLAALLWP